MKQGQSTTFFFQGRHHQKLWWWVVLWVLFSSCMASKPAYNLNGEWKLTRAESCKTFTRKQLTTGYEGGIFSFWENGKASYRQDTLHMEGGWWIGDRQGPFQLDEEGLMMLDAAGNIITSGRTELRIKLQGNGRVIKWNFGDIRFGRKGNRLYIFINLTKQRYRYVFERCPVQTPSTAFGQK